MSHRHGSRARRAWSAICLVLAAVAPAGAQDEAVDLSAYYGFGNLEMFKLSDRSANLLAADFNQDGLTDLVVADNSHSRLDLLIQRKTKPDVAAVTSQQVNAIEDTWRFEHKKIAVDREVIAMAVGRASGPVARGSQRSRCSSVPRVSSGRQWKPLEVMSWPSETSPWHSSS